MQESGEGAGPGRAREVIRETFASRMQQLRSEAGLSQRELAERLAQRGLFLDPSAVTRIERGSRPVRIDEAVLIAQTLGTRVGELIDELEAADDRQGLVAFFKGTLEWQRKHYGSVVEGTKDLLRMQDYAGDQLEVARARDDWDPEEVALMEAVERLHRDHTPWVAVREGEDLAGGLLYYGDLEERRRQWVTEEDLLRTFRLAFVDGRDEPDDWAGALLEVIKQATYRLNVVLAHPEHRHRAESASAEEAVKAGHELATQLGLEHDPGGRWPRWRASASALTGPGERERARALAKWDPQWGSRLEGNETDV